MSVVRQGLLHRRCHLAVAVVGREDNEEVEFSLTRNSECGDVSCSISQVANSKSGLFLDLRGHLINVIAITRIMIITDVTY